MFPFSNIFQSFNISGAELLQTLDILQSGAAGLYQFGGIQTTVRAVKPSENGGGFKFVSARMMNG